MNKEKATLLLEDGTTFQGFSFGSKNDNDGEVVFNTGMVGYPETLTDPSYRGQILVCTYPLIGNYGVPDKSKENNLFVNFESGKIQIQGFIVSEYSFDHSHWSAVRSLDDWMVEENIPGIYGIDTRALTRKLREEGTMLGKIIQSDKVDDLSKYKFKDPNIRNLASEVSITSLQEFKKGKKKIAIVDCGVKNNIVHAFLRRDITVYHVPHNYNFLDLDIDGAVISNGPGDPKQCTETIANIKKAMEKQLPMLGICLGCQIMALAAGADTYKLKYGHRGQNQPVDEFGSKRCYITSQNHGYAIDGDSLPQDWHEWFVNDNDETNEGIIHISKPFFGAQFHPEASPGPDDTEFIFDMFVRAL